jgi:hypothetical protein
LLAAHKARLKSEPGTLQFEVRCPKTTMRKFLSFMYRDAAAFEAHLKGPSLAQRPPRFLSETIATTTHRRHMVGAEEHLGGGGEVRRAADRPRAETNVTFLRRWSGVRFWGVKETID